MAKKRKIKKAKPARILGALGCETRFNIFRALIAAPKGVSVKEMKEKFKIEPTLLSHHLSVLKGVNLITGIRNGKERTYTINKGAEILRGKKVSIGEGCKMVFA